ncbi:MAG: hypothetical protein LQ348_003424 [Seirophora lacunosa]|nr:MAG: hypothetical protein LQ348_003424 [Seirophora lacunosa]
MIVPRLEPTPESSASTSFDPTELITINTAVHTLFYIIVGACVLARFYTTISTKRLGLEDCLMLLYYLYGFFIKLLRCIPVEKSWKSPLDEESCIISDYAILLSDCIVSLITDAIIFALPIPLIWQLQTSWNRKLRIYSVFAGGTLACAAIIARCIVLTTAEGKVDMIIVTKVGLWAVAEVNIGLICACLPVLPKFYKNVVKSAKTIISRTSTYHELDKLGRHKGTGGVERARRGGTDQRREDAAAESVALHRQYLGANGNTEVSVTASSGVKEGESRVRSWNGPGILKTVSLATWETPIAHVEHSPAEPSKAVLHSAGPQSIDD